MLELLPDPPSYRQTSLLKFGGEHALYKELYRRDDLFTTPDTTKRIVSTVGFETWRVDLLGYNAKGNIVFIIRCPTIRVLLRSTTTPEEVYRVNFLVLEKYHLFDLFDLLSMQKYGIEHLAFEVYYAADETGKLKMPDWHILANGEEETVDVVKRLIYLSKPILSTSYVTKEELCILSMEDLITGGKTC